MRFDTDPAEPASGTYGGNGSPSTKIGNVVVTPVLDAVLELDVREAAVDVPLSALRAEGVDVVEGHGHLRVPVICHLVRSRGRLILVDTGIGIRPRRGWPLGRLDTALRGLGVDPRDIDVVVNTHMHADHVGWNTIVDGADRTRPYFPNARYLFQQLEWDYWMASGQVTADGSEHLRECVGSLEASAHAEVVSGEVAVTPEVTLVATPGHTPGHVAVGISSAGQRSLIVGDVTHYPAQLAHPDWSPVWDLDPIQAAETREGVFRSLEDDPSAFLMTSHWPYPGVGQILRVAGRRQFLGVDRRSPGNRPRFA